MKRQTLYLLAGVFVVLVLLLRPDNASRYGYSSVHERRIDGYTEFFAPWMPLSGYDASQGDSVQWAATMNTAPDKPAFVIVLRNNHPTRDRWEAEAKQPMAIIVNGDRIEMTPFKAEFDPEGETVSIVSWGGPAALRAGVSAAKKLEIEFGSKRYDLGETGLSVCKAMFLKFAAATKGGK